MAREYSWQVKGNATRWHSALAGVTFAIALSLAVGVNVVENSGDSPPRLVYGFWVPPAQVLVCLVLGWFGVRTIHGVLATALPLWVALTPTVLAEPTVLGVVSVVLIGISYTATYVGAAVAGNALYSKRPRAQERERSEL